MLNCWCITWPVGFKRLNWVPRLLTWHNLHLWSLLLRIWLLTYSMQQSPSWEANTFSASQKIPPILWNPKVHARHLSLSRASPILHQSISPSPRLTLWPFHNTTLFHGEELLAPRPTPQTGGPPLVGFPRLLFKYIRGYPPYWRPFLHPQPEDAPFRGDRDRLITWI